MSDDDSLYDSSSPSPPHTSPPPRVDPTTPQSPILDEGKAVAPKLPSPSVSDTTSIQSSSQERESTGDPAIQTPPKGEGQDTNDSLTRVSMPESQPSPPSQENLPVNVMILREVNNPEEETTLLRSNIRKDGDVSGAEELLGTTDEDGNVVIISDLKVATEVFVVTTNEERVAEAARAKLEESVQDIYPIGSGVSKPALPSPPSPPSAPDRQSLDKDTDTEHEDPDAEQPTAGIERPVQKPGTPKNFTIVRLIENTDKRGNNIKSAIRLRKHYFDADFGDFLLDMSGPRTETAQVRNYAGQERYIPRRMLQAVYQPWDIPSKTKLTDSGVPLPLAFLNRDVTADEAAGNVDFGEEEPVMIMDLLDGSDDQEVQVTDWERKAGRLSLKNLNRQYERPWGILVDSDTLATAWSKAAAPKLPKMKVIAKGAKEKRKYEDDSTDTYERDAVGKRRHAGPMWRKAIGKLEIKKQKDDEKGNVIVADDPIDDEANSPAFLRKKSTSGPHAKKPKLPVGVEDEEAESVKPTQGKQAATKTITGKTTTGKTTAGKKTGGKSTPGKKPAGKKPLGKQPAKKTVAAKKATSANRPLLEAVAQEVSFHYGSTGSWLLS